MDIFTAVQEEYGRRVCKRREAFLGNLFAAPFLRKIEISHTPRRKSKYGAGQEGRPGPPKYRDVNGKNIPKFATFKHRSDLVHDGGKLISIADCLLRSGKKVVTKKNPG